MSIGSRIREYRLKRGFSQSQLAVKLNMTEANISSYERDKSVPPSEKLALIASILHVSTDYLLEKTDDPTPNHVGEMDTAKNQEHNGYPDWATKKDIRDFKKILQDDMPIEFDGVLLDTEDKERLLKVMEALFWDSKKKKAIED